MEILAAAKLAQEKLEKIKKEKWKNLKSVRGPKGGSSLWVYGTGLPDWLIQTNQIDCNKYDQYDVFNHISPSGVGHVLSCWPVFLDLDIEYITALNLGDQAEEGSLGLTLGCSPRLNNKERN